MPSQRPTRNRLYRVWDTKHVAHGTAISAMETPPGLRRTRSYSLQRLRIAATPLAPSASASGVPSRTLDQLKSNYPGFS
jgi:hypothetical protein